MGEQRIKAVAGLDPSLAGFGAAVWLEGGAIETRRYSSRPAKGLVARFDRYEELLVRVFDFLDIWQPRAVVVEHYSFGSIKRGDDTEKLQRGHVDRYELGALLRADLLARDYLDPGDVFEVSPATLKKFIAKGNAERHEVIAAMVDDYDLGLGSHDEYFAAACARMAGCAYGFWDPVDQRQRECLATMTGNPIWSADPANLPF